jgi:hypothetical protein
VKPKRYLVELAHPEDGWAGLQATVAEVREVVAALQEDGLAIRFLRSLVVPEDGTCFLLFEAPSAEAARSAAARAAAVRRVTAASHTPG